MHLGSGSPRNSIKKQRHKGTVAKDTELSPGQKRRSSSETLPLSDPSSHDLTSDRSSKMVDDRPPAKPFSEAFPAPAQRSSDPTFDRDKRPAPPATILSKTKRSPKGIRSADFTKIVEQHVSGVLQFTDSTHTSIAVVSPTTATDRDGLPILTPQQIKDNEALKKAFLKTMSEQFDGTYLLEVASQIGVDGKSPLTVTQIRDALAFGREHRLLDDINLESELTQRLPDAATKTSQLDQTIDRLIQLIPSPPVVNRTAVRQAVLRSIQDLSTPLSPYLLDQLIDRIVRDSLGLTPPIAPPLTGPGLTLKSVSARSRSPKPPIALLGFDDLTGINDLKPVLMRGTKSLSSLFSKSTAEISPASYFNEVRQADASFYSDWWLNFAILQQFAADAKIPADIQHLLDQRSLGYLYQFASGVDPGRFDWQSTPLLEGLTEYHRAGNSALSIHYRNLLGSERGLSTQSHGAIPVSSLQAIDAIKRHFEFAHPTHRVFNMTADNVAHIAQQMINHITQHNGAVLIDINALLAQIPKSSQRDARQLLQAVQDVVAKVKQEMVAQLTNYVRQELGVLGISEAEIATRVRTMMAMLTDRLSFGGTAEVDGQPVLIVNGDDMARLQVFEALNHGGFTAGPAQIIENWTRSATPAEVIAKVNRDHKLPARIQLPKTAGRIDRFKTINDFSRHKYIGDFIQMIDDARPAPPGGLGRPPYIHVLGIVTQQLILGLQNLNIDFDIHKRFTAVNAEPVLQYLYNRILGHLQNAMTHRDNMAAFINDTHLIHEEIATLLAIAQPYKQENLDLGMPAVGAVRPRYDFKNSGMNAFNAVLSGLEAQKGSRSLNVATQKGSYYEESMHVVAHSPHYQKSVMDGEKVPDSIQAIRESLQPGQRLDLFVGEFHHNITTERNRYRPENLIEQVQTLLDADPPLVSDQFTVAIDTTIARTDAPEIQDFLQAFRSEIESGKLNVVMFRSGQKFDMAGMDNFNAGLSVTYNRGDRFHQYNIGAADSYKPAPVNLQGMMHLEHSARKGLDTYRSAIMNAHRQLLEPGHPASLPAALMGDRTDTMLQIAPNEDPNAVFLDIRAPFGLAGKSHGYNDLYLSLKDCFERLASKEGLMLADRPSFGFPHLNITLIPGEKLRINLGLEDETSLKTIRDILVRIDQVGNIAHQLGADVQQLQTLLSGKGEKLLQITKTLAAANLQVSFDKTAQGLAVRLQPDDAARFSVEHLTTLGAAWASAGFGDAAMAVLDLVTSRRPLTVQQQADLTNAYFDSVTALANANKVDDADRLLTNLEPDQDNPGGLSLIQLAEQTKRFVQARQLLIQKMVQPTTLAPIRAIELIDANLVADPQTSPVNIERLATLFASTWETNPEPALLALSKLRDLEPDNPRRLEFAARVLRSPALPADRRSVMLTQLRKDIVTYLSDHTVKTQTGLSGSRLDQIRRMLKEYRESMLASGSPAFEQMMTDMIDRPEFAPLFQAAPELRLEALAGRTDLALQAHQWERVQTTLAAMTASVPPAPLRTYSQTVAKAIDTLVEADQGAIAESILLAAVPKGVGLVTQQTSADSLRRLTRLMVQLVRQRPDVSRAQADPVAPSIFDRPEFAALGASPDRREAQLTRETGERKIAAIRFLLEQIANGLSAATEPSYRDMLEQMQFDFRDFFQAVPDLNALALHHLAAYHVTQRKFSEAISWAEKSASFVANGQGIDLDALTKRMIDAGAEIEAGELQQRVAIKLPPTLLRQSRQLLRLTQEQLAAKLGVTRSTIVRWESDYPQPPLLVLPQIKTMLVDLAQSSTAADRRAEVDDLVTRITSRS